ncbi:hypothetical protein PG984_004968 [Apiospora sp. TS-2023a]
MFALSLLSRAGSLTATCAVLAGGLFFFCIYYLYVRHLFSPFRKLPSPAQGPLWLRLLYEPRLPEIEHWIDTIPNDGLIRYHGLFNRERVFITSPEATREFLTTSAYKFVKPQLQYTLANLIAGRGLLILEGEEHKRVRKTLNPAFSPANLREWFPAQWKAAVDALGLIPRYTDLDVDYTPQQDGPQSPFSGATTIQVPIAAASIDMVGHFGYGVDFGTIDSMSTSKFGSAAKHSADKKKRFARAFIHMFKTTRHGQLSLEAASIIGPAIALRLPLRAVNTIKGIMGLFYDTIRDIVEDHERGAIQDEKPSKTPPQGRTDLLSLAVRSGALSHPDLVEEGVHMTSAGTETLIGTTTWAMHLLSRHPEVQSRLREEIRAHIPSPYDNKDGVSQPDLRKLPYLNAVMNEVLRFHSVNGILWRECVEPAVIAGTAIPKGTTMTFSPWALNRDPRHWGPSARVFDPERWVSDPTTGGADHAYSFATFGGGPRRCIRENYARDQLLCVLAAYVGRYELAPLGLQGGRGRAATTGRRLGVTLR